MRLSVAVVLFLVVSSHAETIDLYKPVKICSSLSLLDVVTKVCQTPLGWRRRRAAYGGGKGSNHRQLVLRSTLKDENEAEMNKMITYDEFAEQCCYKECEPVIFLRIC
ncbi:uncharacterized protein LOC144141633 [Haemaphysalis longicornis]